MRHSMACPFISISPWENLQWFAHGNFDLSSHQVNSSNFFRYRMLDLNSLIDLEKIIIAIIVNDELHGTGVGIPCRLRNPHGSLADFIAQLLKFVFEQWGW